MILFAMKVFKTSPKRFWLKVDFFGSIRKMASVVVSISQVSDSDADEPPTPMKVKPVKPKVKSEKKTKSPKKSGEKPEKPAAGTSSQCF